MGSRERLFALDELAPGTARGVDVAGRRLALVRIDDDVYAVSDRCTHQDISLSEGEVLVEERQIECWKHGSAFSLETGAPSSLPATKAVATYDVEVIDGDVWVVIP
jgi:3-phenylpropionate/trans-cinnamate dioxygenase ferredoxin subunit